jgi:GTP pyrophosphokinase
VNETERAAFHEDFERALAFATRLHARQVRKETDIPYISHLIAVAGLVLENGGDRDQAIAALLHDSIEDGGVDYPGGVTALREDIQRGFGSGVLAIVEGCTDAETIPKPPWRQRKAAYIAHLEEAPAAVLLVSCADKLHNSRAIVADLRVMGDSLFDRFSGGRDGTLWYYESLTEVFGRRGPEHLAGELGRTVETMRGLAG